jgi:hypothetical protein
MCTFRFADLNMDIYLLFSVRAPHGQGIAFTARLSHNLYPLGAHQVVAFDTVVTNIGNRYNPQSGTFTCSVGGVYVFGVTLMTPASHFADLTIVKNKSVLCHVFSSGAGGDHASSFCMATVHLVVGDNVRVSEGSNETNNWLEHEYSSFSGFLLLAD